MPRSEQKLLHGTLDTLILKTLTHGARHGYAIGRWIEEQTSEAIVVEEGSLYPALYRLRDRGLISSAPGTSEEGRQVKVYSLTRKGRSALKVERDEWRLFAEAVEAILMTG